MTSNNTLIIGDTHIPFVHRDYLEFCRHTADKYKCRRICHVGDIVDNHAIGFHDSDPSGKSAGDELALARKELTRWTKAFPAVFCAIGNHDELAQRQAYANGLPKAYLKSYQQVLGLPASWRFDFEWIFGNWMLTHLTGCSGHDAAFKRAINARISTAGGHVHASAGVRFHASKKDIVWGLLTGCGLDRKSYAFAYGRDFLAKPILGCGVVLHNGTVPLFEPMPL